MKFFKIDKKKSWGGGGESVGGDKCCQAKKRSQAWGFGKGVKIQQHEGRKREKIPGTTRREGEPRWRN